MQPVIWPHTVTMFSGQASGSDSGQNPLIHINKSSTQLQTNRLAFSSYILVGGLLVNVYRSNCFKNIGTIKPAGGWRIA